MLALSVRNPWAWAIMDGLKQVECRSWPTAQRGLLGIHVSCTVDPLSAWPDGSPVPAEALAPGGAILGVVELVDCVRARPGADDPWAEPDGW